jgi:beta-galactosidase/beta-glucuronidase
VWLEYLERDHVESVKYYPDIFSGSITVKANFKGKNNFTFTALYEGEKMGEYKIDNVGGEITFTLPLKEKHLWEVGCGRLYDVEMSFGKDVVKSYFGLRQVRLDGMRFLINEKSVFHRLVLDQGFYPDGIYTAPTDADLKKDIELSIKAGFNGARLHQKVFEERFLYHADKLGYIVWGEFADFGLDHTEPDAIHHMLPQWIEAVDRDFNHPAIVGWCPMNEVWDLRDKKPFAKNVENIYYVTKAMDSTRPCIDASGGLHTVTDVFCVHDYTQDPEEYRKKYQPFAEGGPLHDRLSENNPRYKGRHKYNGEACFISEYGGIGFALDETAWGYGKNHPKTKEEFYQRFKGLTDVILDNPNMFGLCYTQLTNVEQEQNGIYFYDRTEKFDVTPLREALSRKAKIEEE